jgi:hypothetical protein
MKVRIHFQDNLGRYVGARGGRRAARDAGLPQGSDPEQGYAESAERMDAVERAIAYLVMGEERSTAMESLVDDPGESRSELLSDGGSGEEQTSALQAGNKERVQSYLANRLGLMSCRALHRSTLTKGIEMDFARLNGR